MNSPDLLTNFAFAFGIVVLWLICGGILYRRRGRVPGHYVLVWGAATALGILQFSTLLHVVAPATFDPSLFLTGVLRGVALVLLMAFVVWTSGHPEVD